MPERSPAAAGVAAGVDVGGTKILGVVLDTAGEVRVPTPAGRDVASAIVALAGRLGESHGPLEALGVGIPGLIGRDGHVATLPNLPGLEDYPLGAELRERLGLSVVVDNDANCAAWAEFRRGAAAGASHVVVLTLGTGIGGGLITDGRLVQGAFGFAGEPGHMVVDPHGPPCPCGRRGCWERFASGSGLGSLGREAAVGGRAQRLVELAGGDPEAVRGEHVTRAAAEGDSAALEVYQRFGWWVGLGVANLVNLLDPELVVLGGGVVEAGDLLLDPVREAFHDLVLAAGRRPEVPIVAASMGEHAGAVGAALLAARS